ncbi:MAG: hypothetical protein IJQ85_06690 [Selenomonadaceae bacterium]|nr:hypothetical protein [Selenomonadaceae bacterium]
MRKKLITGAAVLALLMNAPQVSAEDDIVIFGGEFEDEAPSPKKKSTPIEKPAPPKPKVVEPKKELPPVEKPAPPKPEIVEPQNKTPTQPIIDEPKDKPAPPINRQVEEQPIADEPTPPAPIDRQVEEQPIADEPTPLAPINRQAEEQPIVPPPINQPEIETLPHIEQPFKPPTNISGGNVEIPSRAEESSERRYIPSSNVAQPQSTLKTLKQRFIKLAVDDTYIYYLDKTSVQWRRVPYLANEYMADVWIRMIERDPKPLDDDMSYYGADNFRAEVALARDQGYQYSPEDLKVLRSQAYVLEHYYLRPKTKQIQFLCELEVFGRPQNAINERAYEYKNWENLVPGSVESAIYNATIKIIGKSKADERGHMTFADMLDEYARIALN